MALLVPSASRAVELGVTTGGNIKIHDLVSEFAFGPYVSSDNTANPEQKAVFFLPILFSFPDGPTDFRMAFVPTFEYDWPFGPKGLNVTPQLGLSLNYLRAENGAGGTIHGIGVGVIPGLTFKYIFSEHWVARLTPLAMEFLPWTYSSGGAGSDARFSVAYRVFAGLGYMF